MIYYLNENEEVINCPRCGTEEFIKEPGKLICTCCGKEIDYKGGPTINE